MALPTTVTGHGGAHCRLGYERRHGERNDIFPNQAFAYHDPAYETIQIHRGTAHAPAQAYLNGG